MKIQDFEQMLKKEVSDNIEIVDLSQHNITDIMGVRYNDPKSGKQLDICACPAREIFEESNPGYTDDFGRQHKTIPGIRSVVEGFVEKLKDEETYNYLTMSDDELDKWEKSKK